MFDYDVSIWFIFVAAYCAYHLGLLIGEVRATVRFRFGDPNKVESKHVVEIDIHREDDTFYAYDAKTKKFLVQSTSYESLQLELSKLNDRVTWIIDEASLKKIGHVTKI